MSLRAHVIIVTDKAVEWPKDVLKELTECTDVEETDDRRIWECEDVKFQALYFPATKEWLNKFDTDNLAGGVVKVSDGEVIEWGNPYDYGISIERTDTASITR